MVRWGSLDGINAVWKMKKLPDLMIRDLVVTLAVSAEPVERRAKLALVKANEPPVVNARERAVCRCR